MRTTFKIATLAVMLLGSSLELMAQNVPNNLTLANEYLDINNVKALFNCDNLHFSDAMANPRYEVPRGSGKHTLANTSLWIGGLDGSNNLHTSAQTYRQTGTDFWPGPLITDANHPNYRYATPATAGAYNKMYAVTKAEILAFLAQPTTIPTSILNWPGNGNSSLGIQQNLAPFVDVNQDGLYRPQDGDYPKIKGDKAIYWVVNDNGNVHGETGGRSMGIELHYLAYAYDAPSIDALNNSIFVDYKIINRSDNDYNNVYVGLWADGDVGYYNDDLAGCDVSRNSLLFYNGAAIDDIYGTNAPIQSITFLKGIQRDADGQDNPMNVLGNKHSFLGQGYGNGVLDDETFGMSKCIIYNNDFTVQGNPEQASQYYNYLSGKWKDGTAMTYGANGLAGTVVTDYMYPGNSDPSGLGQGGVAQAPWFNSNTSSDKRGLMSMGAFNLARNEEKSFTVLYGTAFPAQGETALKRLQRQTDFIRYGFTNEFFTSIEEDYNSKVQVYPNPFDVTTTIKVSATGVEDFTIFVYDLTGKVVFNQNYLGTNEITLSKEHFQSGLYLYKIQHQSQILGSGKLLVK